MESPDLSICGVMLNLREWTMQIDAGIAMLLKIHNCPPSGNHPDPARTVDEGYQHLCGPRHTPNQTILASTALPLRRREEHLMPSGPVLNRPSRK